MESILLGLGISFLAWAARGAQNFCRLEAQSVGDVP